MTARLSVDGDSFNDCLGEAKASVHAPPVVKIAEAADAGVFTNEVHPSRTPSHTTALRRRQCRRVNSLIPAGSRNLVLPMPARCG